MNAIYKFVLGMIGKRSGVVTTLPNQKQIEFQANMLAEKFMQNGIDPNALKSPEQVKNVLANIDQANMRVIPADSAEGASISRGLGIAKKADVMDMEGNKIPDGAKIMGGKQIQPINMTVEERTGGLLKGKYESDEAIKARLVADNKKGIKSIKINLVDDSIAKIKSMEPIEAMKEANLVAGKKGRYANLDDNQVKKIMDDTQDHIFERDIPDEDFATGGRVGLKGGSGFLKFLKKFKVKQSGDDVKEFLSKKKFMKDIVGNTEKAKNARELRMLKEAAEKARAEGGFKFKDVDVEKDIKPIFDQSKDRTLNSDGGRIGYKAGSVDKMRRLFLQAIGAGTAGIAGAKSGIFSFGKGAGKTVAKEVAQQTTSSMPPPYFFKLAEKIKMMGDDVTATTERTIAKKLKSKDGKSEYLLEEDLATGDTSIKKIYKEDDNMITDVEIMELKKGEVVQTKDGKAIKTPDEYEEVTEVNKRIYKDDYNASDYTDGINVDEIIKEVDDTVPSIKYASGGLAYMLGE